jgi:hypothetical protein
MLPAVGQGAPGPGCARRRARTGPCWNALEHRPTRVAHRRRAGPSSKRLEGGLHGAARRARHPGRGLALGYGAWSGPPDGSEGGAGRAPRAAAHAPGEWARSWPTSCSAAVRAAPARFPRRSALRCLSRLPAGARPARRIALAPASASAGVRVLVPRPRERAERSASSSRNEGAEVLAVPLSRLEPPTRPATAPGRRGAPAPLRLGRVRERSVSVTALVEAARTAGTLDVLRTPEAAAVGPGTAATLAAHGLEPTLVAGVSTGQGLAEALVPRLQPGEGRAPCPRRRRDGGPWRRASPRPARWWSASRRTAHARSGRRRRRAGERWVAHPPAVRALRSPRTVEAFLGAPRGAGAGPAGQCGSRSGPTTAARSPGAGLGAGRRSPRRRPPRSGWKRQCGPSRGRLRGSPMTQAAVARTSAELHAELRPQCAGAGEAPDAEPGPGRAHQGAGPRGPAC